MSPLPLPALCLVTDRRVAGPDLVRKVARAVRGGVNLVQLRDKDLSARALLGLAEQLRDALEGRALLLVNDRLDVALAARADGVHLPEQGLPLPHARSLAPHALVGRSVHGVEAAAESSAAGADYLLLGTIFPTASKPGLEGAGVDLVRNARARCAAPLLAIGGIDADNAASVVRAGADGVAVISAILASPDPAAAAARLRVAVELEWARRGAVMVSR